MSKIVVKLPVTTSKTNKIRLDTVKSLHYLYTMILYLSMLDVR